MIPTAWAVRDANGVNVESVSTSRQGAIRNWLYAEHNMRWAVLDFTRDGQVEHFWQQIKGSAVVLPVTVKETADQ
jgi:hypothetical protein